MDPTQALIDIIEALNGMSNEEDGTARQDAIESLDSLSAWIKQEGFPPDVETALSAIEF
jgi:hypothetical protein